MRAARIVAVAPAGANRCAAGGGGDHKKPPHAVAEHGFAARDYKRKACYGSGGIVRRRRSRPKS